MNLFSIRQRSFDASFKCRILHYLFALIRVGHNYYISFFLLIICYTTEKTDNSMYLTVFAQPLPQFLKIKCHKNCKQNATISKNSLEADVVLHLDDGRYALIECKLGSSEIENGAAYLLELQRLIREHNLVEKQMPIREPDLLIVLTGGQYGYRRKDGVYIIP